MALRKDALTMATDPVSTMIDEIITRHDVRLTTNYGMLLYLTFKVNLSLHISLLSVSS